mgnify:CR=1 FL=1
MFQDSLNKWTATTREVVYPPSVTKYAAFNYTEEQGWNTETILKLKILQLSVRRKSELIKKILMYLNSKFLRDKIWGFGFQEKWNCRPINSVSKRENH